MTEITHHLPDWLVRSYATGSLGHAFSLVVAAHVSQCDECRARLEAEELAGGLVLDDLKGMAPSDDLRRRVFDGLDDDDVIVAFDTTAILFTHLVVELGKLLPEAIRGGAIGLVRNGDLIRLDCQTGELNNLSDTTGRERWAM